MSGKVNLDRWMPHLVAAKREGRSLAAYARKHGLSQYTLYAARETLRRAKVEPKERQRSGAVRRRPHGLVPAFAAVEVAAPPMPLAGALARPVSRLCAQLPNGIAVQLQCAATDAALVATALETLAALPCSASTRS